MTDAIYPGRWPVEHPDRIQLYSIATPNGQKISVALEEIGLAYEAHKVDIMAGQQHDPDYARINPNEKIPTIIDPDGPGGEPIAVFETGAILMYLADKTGQLMSPDPRLRWETIQWVFFQMANVGPFFGQFGHFYKFAPGASDYSLERYADETRRLLGVLDRRLDGRDYLVGDALSIADIATFPWVMSLEFYGGKDVLGYDSFANVEPWVQRCATRPAAVRGLAVTGFGS